MDWIFSHLDDLESMDVSEGGRSAAESEGGRDPPPGPRVRDGPGSEFQGEGWESRRSQWSLPQNMSSQLSCSETWNVDNSEITTFYFKSNVPLAIIILFHSLQYILYIFSNYNLTLSSPLSRVWVVCVHQSYGDKYDVRPLRLSHQEESAVSCLFFFLHLCF